MDNKELLQAIKEMIQEEIHPLKAEISAIKEDLSLVKEDLSLVKDQQNENTQFIKAILHNTETANAEINALKLTTLSKEALSHLATKDDLGDTNDHLKALNERLFHQEAALSHLKAVK